MRDHAQLHDIDVPVRRQECTVEPTLLSVYFGMSYCSRHAEVH